MESHILNTYHQARYRNIGHKVMRSKSDSLSSSESSYNQNSPEYTQHALVQQAPYVERTFEKGGVEDWCKGQVKSVINTTQSSHDATSDEESSQEEMEDAEENIVIKEAEVEENITIQEDDIDVDVDDDSIDVDDEHIEVHEVTPTNALPHIEDTLVEGHDYDVITVYTVNPDLDLIEASSDDEHDQQDFAINDKVDDEYNSEDNSNHIEVSYASNVCHDLGINLDTPVVSNVDEYFIKNNNNEHNILDSDEPVVKDVDEYFIKDKGKDSKNVPNVDDFFIKHKLPEEESTQFHMPTTLPSVEEFLVSESIVKLEPKEVEPPAPIEQETAADVSINESDLEVLPNIEELKRFLLEDMTYTKFKNIQRSCSVPQSPMQNICMDIDDAKTCLSFEDLNLDLSDLAFDNDKAKSDTSVNKSDDIPRTLTDEDVNSFLITNQNKHKEINLRNYDDDLSHQDMEIERHLETTIETPIKTSIDVPNRRRTSTPIPTAPIRPRTISSTKLPYTPIPITPNRSAPVPTTKIPATPITATPKVLDFCIEKTAIKKEAHVEIKTEPDDFVDVESCNDTVIPVLEANNLSSLLEQFEATEKLNTKTKRPMVKIEEQKTKSVSKNTLTNGMRLQDAGVQLNKNKMRQILMPSTINTTIRRSPSPVHSDHDYCSSKKRHSLPNLKRGQSLLKPEVLSSNSRILNSRHRSCKNKKVVYHLSSDDESEKCNSKNKKVKDDSDIKKKQSVKPSVKPIAQPNCRKKLSPTHSEPNDIFKDKSNSSVIVKSASKAGDTSSSQNSNGSIKLTIKNKSEVILNCDHIDSQKDKHIDKCKSSSVIDKPLNNVNIKVEKNIDNLDRNKNKSADNVPSISEVSSKDECSKHDVSVKEEPRPKEHFYTALFSNKQDVQLPQTPADVVKTENRPFDDEMIKCMDAAIKKESEPLKKKKLNLQEYKLRRCVNSNNSSATVSPEAIFPDMPSPTVLENNGKYAITPIITNGLVKSTDIPTNETPKKIFDPIREASRKILMNTKKQKAEATRKRDEDIVMSKIPKVENLELQPLISDAEMMKIVGMANTEAVLAPVVNEKPQLPADYEEIIRVSIGTNTDESMFKDMAKEFERAKRKSQTPPVDSKSLINFKIKKSDHVLKQNVFDTVKRDKRSPVDEKKHAESKIDKERYKDITATLKSVGKQVDKKIVGNSLFASIQDVVMKKAPDEVVEKPEESRHSKPKSPEKRDAIKFAKATIVRQYDTKAEHGEDKVILHLGKHRSKPHTTSIVIQTDSIPEFIDLPKLTANRAVSKDSSVSRRRNDSDMSMSSGGSPVRTKDSKAKSDERIANKKTEMRPEKRSQSKEKRSRSKERYEPKYRRRSRSLSRSRRRRRSHTRSRSRSRGRFRRYRRSDSPYKRKRRSRSPYHKRRSPSVRREHRSNRSRSRSRQTEARSKSPVAKKLKPSPLNIDRKPAKSMTPPLRKATVSESSDSSTSSSSSSSSSSSNSSEGSINSQRSGTPFKRDEPYRKPYNRSFSSEDRESNTPVEERRIVFVGKLEKDTTKSTLRGQFSKFGTVMEVKLHSKEDGSRYGFVTYQRARDAWSAVEAASTFPQYDVGFGGRRAFCRQTYADLDGLEAKYTESAFHGQQAIPARRTEDMSFEQMLLEMKKKLNQRKNDKKRTDEP